jgi:hypothetical protein
MKIQFLLGCVCRLSGTLSVLIIQILISCKSSPEKSSPSLFTPLTPEASGISFVNVNTEDADHNILQYEYFYNGGGVGLGDINDDGLVDIYLSSNQGENKLYLNKGNLSLRTSQKMQG